MMSILGTGLQPAVRPRPTQGFARRWSVNPSRELRILLSGDAYITGMVLDIAATASHTSVRPSTTAQRNIQLLEAEGRCPSTTSVRCGGHGVGAVPSRRKAHASTTRR